ncbi:MAG: type II secretion system protein [Candidatus Gracilibacteria bacterium]|nr:type II secretion system protein [Candidatus Gracilibacteria bacterium]
MTSHQIKAFTLVELIIVITILAILASIGFMSYQSYTADARDSSRITSLKTVYDGLTLSYVKKQTYPSPDDYIDIVGVSKQGYIGDTVNKSIRGEGFKDPKDNNRFLYSLDSTGKKIELSGYLENKNKIILSKNNSFLSQAFAGNIDYTNRYIYTIGNNVGILLNSTTNAPVNEIISTGSIDLTTNTGTYTAVFSDTGSISGSGVNLLSDILVMHNYCGATNYNGYSIPPINNNTTQNITQSITGGTFHIDVTCTNGVLSYTNNLTTCNTSYHTEDGGISCVPNTKACNITNGVGNQTWDINTSTWLSCNIVSCNTGYSIIGGSCLKTCNSYSSCYAITDTSIYHSTKGLLTKVSGIWQASDGTYLGAHYEAWFGTAEWATRTYYEASSTNYVSTAMTVCSNRGLRLPTNVESGLIKDYINSSANNYWTSTILTYYYAPNQYRALFNKGSYNFTGPAGDDQRWYTHDIICISN